jgi:ATP-dependent DNA ligase
VRWCLIDGEAIAFGDDGVASFEMLRHRRHDNATFEEPGNVVFKHACALGCEGIVSKRLGSRYRSGRSKDWLKFKNPNAPAAKREAEEDWGKERWR